MTGAAHDLEQQSRVSDTQAQLSRLFDAHSCSICHDVLNAPVSLPCQHMFCSECVRRHLISHSVCPHPHCSQTATATTLTPQRSLDDVLEPIRAAYSALVSSAACAQLQQRHAQTLKENGLTSYYLPCLSHRDPGAKPKLVEKLRQNNLPTTGNVRVLAARYREFVLKWNANLDANIPQSKQAIIELVMKEERSRDINNNGTSRFAPSTATRSSGSAPTLFFRKVHVVPPRPKSFPQTNDSGSGANSNADLSADGDLNDVVAEGDDFDTLIRKTRLRDQKRKRAHERERELVEEPSPQEDLASPSSKRPRGYNTNTESTGRLAPFSQSAGLSVVSTACVVDVRPTASPISLSSKAVNQLTPIPPSCVNKRSLAGPRRCRVTASDFFSAATRAQIPTVPNTFSQRSIPHADCSSPVSHAQLLPKQSLRETRTPEPTDSETPIITDEMRRRIAENRRIALDRKRRFRERMQIQMQMQEQEQEQELQQQHGYAKGWQSGGSQMHPHGI